MGIVSAADVRVDTLVERMTNEIAAKNSVMRHLEVSAVVACPHLNQRDIWSDTIGRSAEGGVGRVLLQATYWRFPLPAQPRSWLDFATARIVDGSALAERRTLVVPTCGALKGAARSQQGSLAQ